MLSNTSKYAIRAVIYLALYSTAEKKLGIKVISSKLDLPMPFMGKILQMLAKHNILSSSKGPHGGFSLKKPAMEISVMEIIEIIDGTDAFDTCEIRTSKCSHDEPCSLHDKLSPLRNKLKSIYVTETIADLVSEFRQGKDRIKI